MCRILRVVSDKCVRINLNVDLGAMPEPFIRSVRKKWLQSHPNGAIKIVVIMGFAYMVKFKENKQSVGGRCKNPPVQLLV